MRKTGFLTAFWALAKPYWVSERRTKGLLILAAVVGLSLGIVWLDVQFNTWNRNFYNALEAKDQAEFFRQFWIFTGIALVWIVAAVYRLYLQQMLQIEWRAWVNDHFLKRWLADRAYYRLQLVDRGVDNPDQRIAEDLRLFVDNTLDLGLGLLSSVVTLVSFTVILWTLSSDYTIGGVTIPGFMFWAVLLYSIFGSWVAHMIGRKLIGLGFNQQRFEADYRYSLVRLRENAEGVALYKGEVLELTNFRERFAHVIDNWWGIMRTRKRLNWVVSFLYQFSVPFPYIIVAPRYFAGEVPLGYIFQVSSAFLNVRGALWWFIDVYPQFAAWKATVDRLTSFNASLDQAKSGAAEVGGERGEAPGAALGVQRLELDLPQGKPLLAGTSIEFKPGESVLVTGPSGAGKSTFFRALAGIWPYWKGSIQLPKGARLLFLPQKPYLPIGALRRAVTYPGDPAAVGDAEVVDALKDVGLPQLAENLDRSENWGQVLSGGEQQRLAFARALLNKPDWLFLDEATASLPEEAQNALYKLLRERLPQTTLVSIGHRASLREHHKRELAWQGNALAAV
jgi:vitamin B12/bleomycin/antimicrobial peptide transport system ATP-binding/permease protein